MEKKVTKKLNKNKASTKAYNKIKKMNNSNAEESATIYFDRLLKVVRTRADGSLLNLGGDEQTILIRITNDFERKNDDAEFEYGEGATAGITLQCSLTSKKITKARIDNKIEHVSSCGKVVTIPFRCTLQNFNLRFFSLFFFDAPSALLFCNTYNRYLPRKKENQPLAFSYHDLVRRSKEVEQYEARRCFKEGKCEEKEEGGEVDEMEEEEEALLDGGTEEEEPQRKRKRLDPQSEEDPNEQLNELFLDEQFGYSQTWF